MKYKAARKPLPEIALELHVDAIIEGSVSHSQNLAQVTARLVYAPTDTQLWSKSYQREIQNVLVMQGEVATAIVGEIKVELTGQEQARLHSARPVNPAAQEAYLKGNYLRWGTPEQRQKSKDYFEKAIRIDPSYAPPYAGLANYYRADSELRPSVAMPQARQYAQKALDLDPALADAHLALGAVYFFGDLDWAGADREFKRALELNPGDSEAHRTYANYLSARGLGGEAQAEVRHAQELDPLYITTQVTAGWVFYFARQYAKAAEQCQKALELDPNSAGAYDCLGLSYLARRMYDQAITACQQSVKLSESSPSRAVGLAEAYAAAGKRPEAKEILKQLRARSAQTYVSPVFLARLYLALGEREQALAQLKEAWAGRDYYLVWLNVDPAFDPLHSDDRFQDVLRRVGFSQ
jgi:tetratricopeptide (TPR) repeat protein